MAIVSELLAIPMLTSSSVDIYSGVQRLMGRIYGQLVRPDDRPSSTVLVITHPASAFLGHYLLRPLAEAGVHALGLNTRYAANDSNLIMENVLLDIGATVDVLLGFCSAIARPRWTATDGSPAGATTLWVD